MSYSRRCSTYWCDKCGAMCDIDWHNSGDIYFVLECSKCDWKRTYVDLEDVVRRYGADPKDLFPCTNQELETE